MKHLSCFVPALLCAGLSSSAFAQPISTPALPNSDVERVYLFSVDPPVPKSGQNFKLSITTVLPSHVNVPEFHAPGLDLLETSFNKENIDGEEHHVYVYTMCADHPGKYLITPDNVTSSPASVQPFELTIASSNTLWAYVIFLFCVGIGLFGSLQFRKEGKKELADFVIEKRRINLSWKDAVTYFGVPLLFLLIPFLIAGYATFESLRGAPPYLGSLFALVFVVVPLLVALCLGVLRYRSLFFRRKNVTLPHQTILELVEKVQEEHQWTPVYAGYDCYVGRVMNRNGKSCMEQFVYVVFDKGKVWINTFYNLRQRNLFQSFRLAKGCIYTLENSLSQAEVALKKS